MPGLSIESGWRNLATVKRAISLKENIYKFGISKAEALFGGNFSAYIGYLISRDKEQFQEPQQKKNNKLLSVIEEILDM